MFRGYLLQYLCFQVKKRNLLIECEKNEEQEKDRLTLCFIVKKKNLIEVNYNKNMFMSFN